MPEQSDAPWIIFGPSDDAPEGAYVLHSMHWDEKKARRVAEGIEGAFVSQSRGTGRHDID